ncbi:MAG: hypothetical protein QOE89_1152 [Pseudonocardiales bacterium]|jgi:hypothetical protein|nr:hypothetical protein [Pseudonocardiales bacterium]
MSRVWLITGRAVAEAPVHPHRRTARQLVPLCTRRVAPVTLVDGRCPRVPHTARV